MPHRNRETGIISDVKSFPQLYSVLNENDKRFLLENHTVQNYKRNEKIYIEGGKPKGLLCLGQGKVKVYKSGIGGREQIVRMVAAPGFLGYRALFADDIHIASAVAIEECVIFFIPKDVIFKLVASNKKVCMNILKSFATELGFTRYRTVSLTQKHIRGRLAESLLYLLEIYGYEENGQTLNIKLSREDIANFSNMTTSNAIRTLSTFVNEKVIAVDGRSIKILEEDKLGRISELG
jgi:CRP-like cAMP-binding protein